MDEKEWLKCTEPGPMLKHLWRCFCEGTFIVSERKVRLLACACCRRIHHRLKDPRSWIALDTAEAYADGLVSKKKFKSASKSARKAQEAALSAYEKLPESVDRTDAYFNLVGARAASCVMLDPDPEEDVPPVHEAIYSAAFAVDGYENFETADADQVAIIHDIFGNPFQQSTTLDSSWLTPRVVSLAQEIYDSKAFTRLPMLVDLLREAGCANPGVLGHLSRSGEHVRGCWVLDLLLGKQ